MQTKDAAGLYQVPC